MTPEEVVETAVQEGLGLISLWWGTAMKLFAVARDRRASPRDGFGGPRHQERRKDSQASFDLSGRPPESHRRRRRDGRHGRAHARLPPRGRKHHRRLRL